MMGTLLLLLLVAAALLGVVQAPSTAGSPATTATASLHRRGLQRATTASAGTGGGCLATDVNADGVVSVVDLLLVLQDYGRGGAAAPAAMATDVNVDGIVSVADLLLVLGAYGRQCGAVPPAPPAGAGAAGGGAAGAASFMRVGLTAPPHLVFVLVDDLGFADIFGRSPDIQTPHWDALAASGVTMARFYVQPLCTPARGAFLTGRYPVRLGLQRGVLHPDSVRGLPLDEVTLTQRLKYAGYATAMVGKVSTVLYT